MDKAYADRFDPQRVYCAHVPKIGYGAICETEIRELPAWVKPTAAIIALRSLMAAAHCDEQRLNSTDWNPLEEWVADKKVVLKPNWVFHENASGHGIDCLVTHASVLEAILHYVIKARPKRLVIGDAPIQGCDFQCLMVRSGVLEMLDRLSSYNTKIDIKDFRRTIRPDGRLETKPVEACRSLDDFVLYDLGADSILEEITAPDSEFRVTMYDPDLLQRTHGAQRHQYLIARDVIDADVVFNVPKLKTHKKACITGALKNLVGINGHKEYLPHHRKGSPAAGGDCYPERSFVKRVVEDLLDAANRSRSRVSRWVLANAVRGGMAYRRMIHADDNFEGSWHGNDTVWRMTLDLQRILHYGRADGKMSDIRQRKVITVTDAIIAGEGEGPMAPTPVGLGIMTLGWNTAAVEWINALLMGLAPERVALTREAFSVYRYPVANFAPSDLSVVVDGREVGIDDLFARYGRKFRLPSGWQGAFGDVSQARAS